MFLTLYHRDKYPLLPMRDLLDPLIVGKVFWKIDLKPTYNHICVRQHDTEKITFFARYGHSEYIVVF